MKSYLCRALDNDGIPETNYRDINQVITAFPKILWE